MILTKRDTDRLSGVNGKLAAVVFKAAEITEQRFMVAEGLRTKQRQAELYAQGRTKPGKIVTWTMKSKHIDGLAVDLAPLNASGGIDWNDLKAFARVADAMKAAAKELGVQIRHGGDWDGDGIREKGEDDLPHFELKQ